MVFIESGLHLSQYEQHSGNDYLISPCGSLFCFFLARRKLLGGIEEKRANDEESGSLDPPSLEAFWAEWGEKFRAGSRRQV